MANLSDLPNETLLEILSLMAEGYRARHKASRLSSLSILSRRLFFLLRPLIWKEVYLTCIHHHKSIVPGPAKIVTLFLRSLEESPELHNMIQRLSLNCIYLNEELRWRIYQLLRSLSKLQHLSITNGQDFGPGVRIGPEFLENNNITSLETLVLNDHQLTFDELQKYLVLTRTKNVRLNLRKYPLSIPSKSMDLMAINSHLSSLYLSHDRPISSEVLSRILGLCPRVRKLNCPVPGQDFCLSHPRQMTVLSYTALCKALISVKDSLQELVLRNYGCACASASRGALDFNSMRALNYLNCPADCFFFTRQPFISRKGLYKLLPASLEKMAINFQNFRNHGIANLSNSVRTMTDDQAMRDLQWLVEIADNKTLYTPHLQILMIKVPPLRTKSSKSWNPPRPIAESFHRENILLEVKVT